MLIADSESQRNPFVLQNHQQKKNSLIESFIHETGTVKSVQ